MQNKNTASGFLLVLLVLLIPGFSGCREKEPQGLVLNAREIFLHPGDSFLLKASGIYATRDGQETGPLPSSGEVVFRSSRPKTVPVDPLGQIALHPEVLKAGTALSGESAEITVEYGSLEQICRVVLRMDPERTIDARGILSDPQALDALVNKTRSLPGEYIPPNLVRVKVPTILVFEEVNHLRRIASEALSSLFLAAREEGGFELTARSGYRSWTTQKHLYQSNVDAHGQDYADRYSAKPGTSEHQTGLVMDITSPGMNYQLDESFGDTSEGRWVADNAHRFGFIIRYKKGKEEITGYAYEPWHLRYVGIPLAQELFRRDLVLEEFFLLPDSY